MRRPSAIKLDSASNVYILDTRTLAYTAIPGRVLVMSCATCPSANAGISKAPRDVRSHGLALSVALLFVGLLLC